MKSIYQAVFRNNDAVLPEAKKYSYSLPLAFCSRVVEAFLLVYAYFLVYPALQHLFSGTLTLEFILSTSLIMLVCFAARAVLFYYSAMHIYSGIYSINGAMSLKIAEHLKRLPLGHFQKRELNNVKSILTDDMNVISMYSGTLLGFFVTALCIPLFILIGLALIDWRFALALSVTTILALPVLKLTMAFIRHYGRKHLENMSATSARLVEYVLGIKVLKSYGMYGQRFDKLEQALTHQKNSSLTLELGAIGLLIIAFIAVELGLATALLYGSYSYLTAGQIDPAILFSPYSWRRAFICRFRMRLPFQPNLITSSNHSTGLWIFSRSRRRRFLMMRPVLLKIITLNLRRSRSHIRRTQSLH